MSNPLIWGVLTFEASRILNYVKQRSLERVRTRNILNFGSVLAKSLPKGVPPNGTPIREKLSRNL